MKLLNLSRLTILCLMLGIVALLTLPSAGCSTAKARSAVKTQLRINAQIAEWHLLIDSVITGLADERITEEQALFTLEQQIAGTEGNVKLIELWQSMRTKIEDGEPIMAVLLDASTMVGELSKRYQLALEQLEADLADAEDSQDATLMIIASAVTLVTGVPVAGLFSSFTSRRARNAGRLEGHKDGRAQGIEDGAFYGAAKVASAIAAGRKADPSILGGLHDDNKPSTVRVKAAMESDDVVRRAVRSFKDSDTPPTRPV